jgi:apolipoprotein N-acyltransferase
MFAPTICYEDLFDFNFRDYLPDADVLLGSSDLIGMASGLIVNQHAQVSRVRALEYGRPFLRAANGGWSGVIDAQGRWIARLAPGEVGDVRATLDFAPRLTAFGTYGNQPMIALTLSLLAAAFGARVWRAVRGTRGGSIGSPAASATAALPD